MHHGVHPRRTYSNASFFYTQKYNAKFRFSKIREDITWIPSNAQRRALLLGNDIINVQGSMCVEDDVLYEYCIVWDCKQEEQARDCILDWATVLSELYDGCKAMHPKRIFYLLQAENFEINWIRVSLKGFSACSLFVHETGNESLQ